MVRGLKDTLEPNQHAKEEDGFDRDDIAEKSIKFYDYHLKRELECDRAGQYIAIEPQSKQYFLGKSGTQAFVAAHEAMPGARFYVMRVGYPVTHKIGGHAPGKR